MAALPDVLVELKDVVAWIKMRSANTVTIDNLMASLVSQVRSAKGGALEDD